MEYTFYLHSIINMGNTNDKNVGYVYDDSIYETTDAYIRGEPRSIKMIYIPNQEILFYIGEFGLVVKKYKHDIYKGKKINIPDKLLDSFKIITKYEDELQNIYNVPVIDRENTVLAYKYKREYYTTVSEYISNNPIVKNYYYIPDYNITCSENGSDVFGGKEIFKNGIKIYLSKVFCDGLMKHKELKEKITNEKDKIFSDVKEIFTKL